jgi:hypothetical protein
LLASILCLIGSLGSAGSASAAAPVATTTTVSIADESSPYGRGVGVSIITRTTGDASPSGGDIVIYVDGNEWGRVWCCGAFIELVLPRGAHVVRAEYLGNASFAPSSSNEDGFTVTKGHTTASVLRTDGLWVGYTTGINISVGSPYPNNPNQPRAPTSGTITLSLDGVEIARYEDPDGYVEGIPFTVPDNGDAHTLTASYSGNDDYEPSTATLQFTAWPYGTTVDISSSFGANKYDCPPGYSTPDCTKSVEQGTGTVSLSVSTWFNTYRPAHIQPGGTATFKLDGRVHRMLAVSGETTTLSIGDLAVGRHSMSIDYSGNHAFTGGTTGVITFDVKRPPPPPRSGYWMVGEKGVVYAFGSARGYGNAPVGAARAVDIEAAPDFNGYWVVDDTGRVFAFGSSGWHGNAPGLPADERVASLSATKSGRGYWLFTTKGRAFPFGDAPRLPDMHGHPLNGPVLDSIRSASGAGYYMVASDGGIFSFGDAKFFGSMGGHRLNAPVRSLVPDPDGIGYWLVAGDGGVFAFNAGFRGSMGGQRLNKAVVGMVPYGNGYLMVGADGGIFSFSDKPFAGSLGSSPPTVPIVGVAALNE